jgi:lysophospholipase L1-like esterase
MAMKMKQRSIHAVLAIGVIALPSLLLHGREADCQSAAKDSGSIASLENADFALHDGETVVFYGDSITAQRLYTRYVEEFVLTRYPKLHVGFVNAGVPGDKVDGGYAGMMAERVKRDVAPFHPGMITVMLGMNDGWWGTESPEVDAYFKKGYRALLDALHQAAPEASLTLIRPSPYDEITHGTEFPLYSRVIDDLANDVSAMAEEQRAAGHTNVLVADFHQPLIDALQRAKSESPELAALMVPDRIHPSEIGHWIMAASLLSMWHVDPIVSSVTLNAGSAERDGIVEQGQKTKVTALTRTATGLRWTQKDEDLPLPFDFNNALVELLPRISEIGKVDRLMLTVDGLDAGEYELQIDDKVRATFSAVELAAGVNLALLKNPMVDQARDVDYAENQRMQLDQARFVLSADVKGDALTPTAEDELRKAEARLMSDIRSQSQPKPHRFELRRK